MHPESKEASNLRSMFQLHNMNKEQLEDSIQKIREGKLCPYCHQSSRHIDSKEIYGKSYGMVYACLRCDAYIGTHKSNPQLALGRLANHRLREAKKQAHFWFDRIARTDLIHKVWPEIMSDMTGRSKAYLWLSKQLGIELEFCHIGMFDEVGCKAVEEVSRRAIQRIEEGDFEENYNQTLNIIREDRFEFDYMK